MWLYTDIGFFSIVQKDGAGTLTIRSRVREDLENFLRIMQETSGHQVAMPEIIESYDSDYRYRIIANATRATVVINEIIGDIDYDNFKDHIHKKDPMRATIYSRIWGHSNLLEHLDKEEG